MNDIGKYFREEWEVLILAAAALLLLLGLGAHFLIPQAKQRRGLGGGDTIPYKRLFQDQDFVLQQDSGVLPLSRNPFAFNIQGGKPITPPPAPTPDPAPAAASEQPTPPVQQEQPADPPPPEPEATAVEVARPRRQFLPQRISYMFFGQDDKGQTTAMLKVQLQGKASEIMTLSPGDLQAGVRILSVREEAVRVRDARGREVTIQFSESRIVTALVEVE
ncbi:MAG: hypothetical protein GX902_12880 [Lentisphaerae bacterium]|nr:hypothetical protein [Lentisphaerota bacterium]